MTTPPTTYQANQFLSEILDGRDIPEGKLAYFRARLRNRLHELIISTFQKAEERDQLTRARLAKRLSREPAQISRWFSSAGNLELATVSDLLIGMGYEPDFQLVNLRNVGAAPELPESELPRLPSWRDLRAANDPEKPKQGGLGAYADQSQPAPALPSRADAEAAA